MPGDTRTNVRLDPAARRKVERLAAREGISLDQALNRLIRLAPDGAEGSPRRRRYRLEPRRVAFGFDIARARELAAQMAEDEAVDRWRSRS